ncbi:SRPBCC family protein [Kordiimonas aquimaris]|uniref:SRPBCC family protein n=1 Tax=Kordiimonas aquimaris TaxID=707591 RepID=UPI0021D08943|nr:SRPBCC domain-containing protein [Kordiimonas aquimaris]
MNDYNKTIATTADAKTAYAALTTGYQHWWTKPDRPLQKVGDRAKFTFPPGISFWTFEAMKLELNKHIELRCVVAMHVHEGKAKEIETEWLDTRVIWSIEEKNGVTNITLHHIGLTPDLLCFDICTAGWDFFFTESLKAYLDTGTGTPHKAA